MGRRSLLESRMGNCVEKTIKYRYLQWRDKASAKCREGENAFREEARRTLVSASPTCPSPIRYTPVRLARLEAGGQGSSLR